MKNKILLGIYGAAAVALASTANASTDQLRYSTDGINWTVIADGGAGDSDLTANNNNISVTISGGGFNLLVTSHGFSVGTAAHPDMDLDVAGTTTGPGTLYVEYSVLDFTPPTTGNYTLHVGGSLAGVDATESALIGNNNLYAGTDFPIPTSTVAGGGVIGPINGLGDAMHASFSPQDNPYSVTLVTVITSRGSGVIISDDAHLSVPDGGNTLMMLGSALSVVGLGVFRRKAAKKA